MKKTVRGNNWILAGGLRFGKQLHWSLESRTGHKYDPWETAFIGCLRPIRQDSFTLPIIVITLASHMSLICGREYRPVGQRWPSAKSCLILLLENRWDYIRQTCLASTKLDFTCGCTCERMSHSRKKSKWVMIKCFNIQEWHLIIIVFLQNHHHPSREWYKNTPKVYMFC